MKTIAEAKPCTLPPDDDERIWPGVRAPVGVQAGDLVRVPGMAHEVHEVTRIVRTLPNGEVECATCPPD